MQVALTLFTLSFTALVLIWFPLRNTPAYEIRDSVALTFLVLLVVAVLSGLTAAMLAIWS